MKTNKFFLVLFLTFVFILNKSNAGKPLPIRIRKFSAIFVFGDSLVDTGNNNYLHTKLQANYYPYGVDFLTHNATGRFSNGKVLPDMISSLLGIKEFVPPFLNLDKVSSSDIVTGVNFASAGSGFDDLTTLHSNGAPLSEQLFFFWNYLFKLVTVVGEDAAKKIVSDSVVFISAGTHDWIVNYYNRPQLRKPKFTSEGYADFLMKKIEDFVQQLYKIGCRRIIVTGLPPIGCLPYQQFSGGSNNLKGGPCISAQVLDSIAYNGKLQSLIATMRTNLTDAKLFYANLFDPLLDMINTPTKFGFVETMIGCCARSGDLYQLTFMCVPEKPCENPSEYMFWDNIHPTEIVNTHLARYMETTILPILD